MICKFDNAVCICGKGENDYCPIKPLSNEEHFCSLSRADKAEFLAAMVKEAIEVYKKHGTTWHEAVSWWDGWLKEKHDE